MAEVSVARAETAQLLGVEESEVDYVAEVLIDIASERADELGAEGSSGAEADALVNTFYCRKPTVEGQYLYFYRECDGPFGRLARNRVQRVVATGFCTVPTRKYKVFWS